MRWSAIAKTMMIGVATSRPACASDILISPIVCSDPNRPANSVFAKAQRTGVVEVPSILPDRAGRCRMTMAPLSQDDASDEGGDLLLWVLVFSELAAFGILLGGFLVMSVLHPERFGAAKFHLSARIAGFNTV